MLQKELAFNSLKNIFKKISLFFNKLSPKWLLLISAILAFPFRLIKIYQDLHQSNMKTRRIALGEDIKKLCISMIDFILMLTSFFLTGPLIILFAITKELLNNGLKLTMAIYNRFFGAGPIENKFIDRLMTHLKMNIQQHQPLNLFEVKKLTTHINNEHKLNVNLVNKIYHTAFSLIALTGVLLEFTAAATIGTVILTGLSAYTLLDHSGMNPLRWMMKGIKFINHNPFSYVTEKAVIADLENYDKKISGPTSSLKIFRKLKYKHSQVTQKFVNAQKKAHVEIDHDNHKPFQSNSNSNSNSKKLTRVNACAPSSNHQRLAPGLR